MDMDAEDINEYLNRVAEQKKREQRLIDKARSEIKARGRR